MKFGFTVLEKKKDTVLEQAHEISLIETPKTKARPLLIHSYMAHSYMKSH
jgi:hypothetical protein